MTAALLLRLGWIATHAPRTFDEYFEIAESLLRGSGFALPLAGVLAPTALRPPLYPFLLAGWLQLSHTSLPFVSCVQALLGAATCGVAYALGQRVFGGRVGWWCAALVACDFPLIVVANWAITETVYVLLIAALTWLVLATRLHRPWHQVGAGALGAAAMLTRSEAQLYCLLLLVLPLLAALPWQIAGRRIAISLGVTLLCVTPWLMRNVHVLNLWALSDPIFVDYNLHRGAAAVRGNTTDDGAAFYFALRDNRVPLLRGEQQPAPVGSLAQPGARTALRRAVLAEWLDLLRTRPLAVLRARAYNLYRLWVYRGEFFFTESVGLRQAWQTGNFINLAQKLVFYTMFGWLALLLALLGAWRSWTELRGTGWRWLWLYPVFITALMVPLWSDYRYSLPAHVLLAPFVVRGSLLLSEYWRSINVRAADEKLCSAS